MKGQMCSFYQRNGRCRFGSNCRFAHSAQELGFLTKTFPKPEKVPWGYIIGKGGSTLKEIQARHKVSLQIVNENNTIIIHGNTAQGLDAAFAELRIICAKSNPRFPSARRTILCGSAGADTITFVAPADSAQVSTIVADQNPLWMKSLPETIFRNSEAIFTESIAHFRNALESHEGKQLRFGATFGKYTWRRIPDAIAHASHSLQDLQSLSDQRAIMGSFVPQITGLSDYLSGALGDPVEEHTKIGIDVHRTSDGDCMWLMCKQTDDGEIELERVRQNQKLLVLDWVRPSCGVDWRLTLDDPKEYDGNVEAFEAFVEHFSSTGAEYTFKNSDEFRVKFIRKTVVRKFEDGDTVVEIEATTIAELDHVDVGVHTLAVPQSTHECVNMHSKQWDKALSSGQWTSTEVLGAAAANLTSFMEKLGELSDCVEES